MRCLLACVLLLIVMPSLLMVAPRVCADSYGLHRKPLLRSVRFVDEKFGWIAGYGGVFHTSDGGRNWQRQPVSVGRITPREGDRTVENVGQIVWADQDSCIIRGEKDLLVGRAQERQWSAVPLTSPDLLRATFVGFVNQRRGWAIVPGSPGSVVYATTNGGLDWMREFKAVEPLYDVFAVSEIDVWAVGGECKLLHTTDGGLTWKESVVASGRRRDGRLTDFHAVSFTSPRRGWISGLSGTVLRTTDGGNEWVRQETGTSTRTGLFAISFADENEGWVVGSKSIIDNDDPPKERNEAVILHTSDGGLRWETQGPPLEERMLDVQALSNGRAWVVGEDGTVLRTVDHGKKWTRVKLP